MVQLQSGSSLKGGTGETHENDARQAKETPTPKQTAPPSVEALPHPLPKGVQLCRVKCLSTVRSVARKCRQTRLSVTQCTTATAKRPTTTAGLRANNISCWRTFGGGRASMSPNSRHCRCIWCHSVRPVTQLTYYLGLPFCADRNCYERYRGGTYVAT